MEAFVDGVLSGSIPGTVIGDIKLIRGVRGHGLYLNGISQRVDLGNQRHSCLGNLNMCTKGVVMAMWLRMHKYDEPGNYNDEYYFSNGGQTVNSMGIALLMRQKKLLAMFRTETRLWEVYYDNGLSLHSWYHVVLTWSATSGGYVYIDGALGGHNQQGQSLTSNRKGNAYVNFVLGDANNNPPNDPGEMTLDELRIWDAVADVLWVWRLYAADVFPWRYEKTSASV